MVGFFKTYFNNILPMMPYIMGNIDGIYNDLSVPVILEPLVSNEIGKSSGIGMRHNVMYSQNAV